jgi:lysophospholipase L1-like esterase
MTSSRPRRSRSGLVLFLVVLALGALEVTGRVTGAPPVTPLRFVQAAWAVAGGGALPGGGAPPPTDEELVTKVRFRALPYVNFALKPDWTREGALVQVTNSLGFRGREVQVPKPAGRYRIACLGGSTTYDDAVSDPDAYPLRLEEFLRQARPERDIEVVNAGQPNYTTAENIAHLALRVLDLQPDAIVLYEGINDWRPRVYSNFDSAYFHFRKLWDGDAEDWKTGKGEMAGGINPLVQHDTPPDNGSHAANAKRNGAGAFRRNLVTLAGIARAHGIAVVMVSNTADERNPNTPADMLAGLAEHNRVLREVCAEHGAQFIDLDAAYPKGADVPEGGLFADPVHNNAAGSRIKARIVADGLLAGLLK